jgi:hypothetical protein
MGGIMPNSSRDAAIARLRKAALRLQKRRRTRTFMVAGEARQTTFPDQLAFERAWREFPECERDDSTPSPEAALEMCEAYDRQKAEAERFAAQAAGGLQT